MEQEASLEILKTGKIISEPGYKLNVEIELEILGTDTSLPITIAADFSNIPDDLRKKYSMLFQNLYLKDMDVYYNSNPKK
jgi:hypothetical protein